jgi:hypothetical protein
VTLLGVAAFAALAIAACSDKLDAGASCPLLCPEQSVRLLDTTIDAVVADTTITGLPPIGTENFLMLSSHGDTLDTRAIIRFDTLPQTFTNNAVDSTITQIDSAYLLTPLLTDSLHRLTAPVTIEAYDVDTTGFDTSSAVLASLFRADRLIGSKTFAPESLLDSIRVPINTDTVLDRVNHGTRLRVGLKLVSAGGADLRIGSTQLGAPVTLTIKASLDSTATPVTVGPLSSTPTDQTFLAGPLADYTIVVQGGTGASPDLLGVGGVPSRRSYLKFDVPSRIVDSTTIVRAELELTQTPNRRVDPLDSVYVFPLAVLASPSVTDVTTLLQFLGANGQFGLDSLLLAPGDSGQRVFQLVGLVRTWHLQALTVSPRSIALRSGAEGQLPGEIDFISTKGPVALRPRLRITYVPQTSFGVP